MTFTKARRTGYPYTLYTTRISWIRTLIPITRISIYLFFYDISTSSQGSDFFLLTWQSKQRHQDSWGDLYHQQCKRARGGGDRYQGGFFFFQFEIPSVFSVRNDASSWRGGASESSSVMTRSDRLRFLFLLFLFLELGYYLVFWDQRASG